MEQPVTQQGTVPVDLMSEIGLYLQIFMSRDFPESVLSFCVTFLCFALVNYNVKLQLSKS